MEMSNEQILLASVEDVKRFIKEHNALHTDPVTNKVAKAMELIGYEKGFKRGKSVGSHQAYNHAVIQAYWEFAFEEDGEYYFECSNCGLLLHTDDKNARDNYCANCGAKMKKEGDEE